MHTKYEFDLCKSDIIKIGSIHDKDTGSYSVQIALLTKKIIYLTEHLKVHKKDYDCRRSLLIYVVRRKKFLKLLRAIDFNKYKNLVETFKIKSEQNKIS